MGNALDPKCQLGPSVVALLALLVYLVYRERRACKMAECGDAPDPEIVLVWPERRNTPRTARIPRISRTQSLRDAECGDAPDPESVPAWPKRCSTPRIARIPRIPTTQRLADAQPGRALAMSVVTGRQGSLACKKRRGLSAPRDNSSQSNGLS